MDILDSGLDPIRDPLNGICSQFAIAEFGPGDPDFGLHISTKVKTIFFTLGAFSMLASCFVFLTIFTVKKLNNHTNNLIAYISIFEAI